MSGRTFESDRDCVVGETFATESTGQFRSEHRADCSIDVPDRRSDLYSFATIKGRSGLANQFVVEGKIEAMVLGRNTAAARALGDFRHIEDRRKIETRCLPMVDSLFRIDEFNLPDGFVESAEPKRGEQFANFFSDELKKVDHELWFARETGPELRILRCHSNGTCIEMTHTHHDAA